VPTEAPDPLVGTIYPPTNRTVPTRHRDRASYDKNTVHAILDEGLVCHLSFVVDGEPTILPTLYARVDERLYLHGSTGSRLMRMAPSGRGLSISLAVTIIDGLVLARSAFHHSVNYRSVVVHGHALAVTDLAEKEAALAALVDRVAAGRSAECRPPSPRELAATGVLRLDLVEVSAKVRAAGVADEPEDLGSHYWAGVIPVRTVRGNPVPASDLAPGSRLPSYLRATAHKRTPQRRSDRRMSAGSVTFLG
jgi:nitroimidazol reductase NimA-like FMN-containing flavoprotein (pyridoxamine 5'-phosphate oxidase superfamily)